MGTSGKKNNENAKLEVPCVPSALIEDVDSFSLDSHILNGARCSDMILIACKWNTHYIEF